jgi:hypothetical protein
MLTALGYTRSCRESIPRVVYGHDSMSFKDMAYYINKLRPSIEGTLTHSRYNDSIHTLVTMTSLQRRNIFRGSNLFRFVKHDLFLQ